MSEALYSIEEVAEKLNTTINGVHQLAINGELRMGVNARGWWGIWYPKLPGDVFLEDTKSGRVSIDESGRGTYSHEMLDGTEIQLKEFYIHHFWYIEYNQLYELLTSSNKSKEISWYEPTSNVHAELLNVYPSQVSEAGLFWAHPKHNGKQQDLVIHANNLLVRENDLRSIASAESNLPPYMNPYSEFYAEELAIAIKAHEAVVLNGQGNQHQALGTRVENWLMKNYEEKSKSDFFVKRIKRVVLPKKGNQK